MITNEVEVSPLDKLPANSESVTTLASSHDETGANIRPGEAGKSYWSHLQTRNAESLRAINRMADAIRSIVANEQEGIHINRRRHSLSSSSVDPAKVVVAKDQDMLFIGVDSRDRPGLLLEISKALLRLNLQLHHTEAAVVDGRSLSVWRSESSVGAGIVDQEEIWTVLTVSLDRSSTSLMYTA